MSATMATQEQVQEALQRFQAQEARIQVAMRQDRGGAMVDTKGISQPFTLKGIAEEIDRIDGVDDFVGKFYACLVSFTTDAPNRIVGTQAKATAWRPGDACTASTTPRRPCDAWLSFSRFRTFLDASALDPGSAQEDWLSKKR